MISNQTKVILSILELTVVVFDHAADVIEGDFRRDIVAAIIHQPDLVVFDRIGTAVVHDSDWQRKTSCGK